MSIYLDISHGILLKMCKPRLQEHIVKQTHTFKFKSLIHVDIKIAKDGHIALGYLHGALEGMIVARHVGHDLTFVGLLVSQQV